MSPARAMPLASWADRRLGWLRAIGEAHRALSGADLLAERAVLRGFAVPGQTSAGGGCRLHRTRDGWIALNLARGDDRRMLQALFADARFDSDDEIALAGRIADSDAADLTARGRLLGLAIADWKEWPASPPFFLSAETPPAPARRHRPLVVDLSALWAGPLASRLLACAGARVVKVESVARPDGLRADPVFFAALNQGKNHITLDVYCEDHRNKLRALLEAADIVIEAARPRALLQLGIDGDEMVRRSPGKVWIAITGHGVAGEAANWIGFGDDCGVAGGLSAALFAATGKIGFVGDAIADPLNGIYAAELAWRRWSSGAGGRIVLSMSAIAAEALRAESERDAVALNQSLRDWAAAEGQPFAGAADPQC